MLILRMYTTWASGSPRSFFCHLPIELSNLHNFGIRNLNQPYFWCVGIPVLNSNYMYIYNSSYAQRLIKMAVLVPIYFRKKIEKEPPLVPFSLHSNLNPSRISRIPPSPSGPQIKVHYDLTCNSFWFHLHIPLATAQRFELRIWRRSFQSWPCHLVQRERGQAG